MNKVQLRDLLNEKRKALGDNARNKAAQLATELLIKSPFFSTSQNIACYLPRLEEFDCTPIIQTIWAAQKKCYLPILSTDKEGYLEFAAYQQTDILHLNRYRILEPLPTKTLAANELDLVILPLLGFDLVGHRLGAGGGYYDRTFASSDQKTGRTPLLMGLAYSFQCVSKLPFDSWDVSIDGVITEKEIILFNQ